jgi:hypothetical protein
MINSSNQEIIAGNESTNYQAREMHIHGPDMASIIELSKLTAQGVFNDNFIKLRGDAYQLAFDRADELLNDFLNKFKQNANSLTENLSSPSMQALLFDAQQHYAKSGDASLETILVKILVDRSTIPERTISQIVLDESITVVSKMTQHQIDAITMSFALQDICLHFNSLDELCNYFTNIIYIFLPENFSWGTNSSSLQYLEYTGCLRFSETSELTHLGNLFLRYYPHLFNKDLMDSSAVFLYLSANIRRFQDLEAFCKVKQVSTMKLTPVGKAIALSNYNLKTNKNIPLNHVLPE